MSVVLKILLFCVLVGSLILGLNYLGASTYITTQIANVGTFLAIVKGNLLAIQDMFPVIDLIAVFTAYLLIEGIVFYFKGSNYLIKQSK